MGNNIGSGNIAKIRLAEAAAPATPASGFGYLYVKTDGKAYLKNDAGTEYDLTGGASGAEVAARYTSDAGQTISNDAATIINFEDIDYDTDTAVTIGASWAFTCPAGKGGYYHVDVHILSDSAEGWAAGELGILFLYKEGAQFAELSRFTAESATSMRMSMQGSGDVDLAAGETCDVRLYQNTGGNLVLQTSGISNWINIHKI